MAKFMKSLGMGSGLILIAGQVVAAAADVGDGIASEGAKSASPGFGMFMPFLIIFGIFYFLVIAPQRKQQKETEKMQAGLKRGDRVITSSGIHGSVTDIREADKIVVVEVAPNVKIQFSRTAVTGLKNLAQTTPTPK